MGVTGTKGGADTARKGGECLPYVCIGNVADHLEHLLPRVRLLRCDFLIEEDSVRGEKNRSETDSETLGRKRENDAERGRGRE